MDEPAGAHYRLRALELRYVLTCYLQDHGELTVSQLGRLLCHDGFSLWGRPSKTISDALRWEIRRGRVVRLGRGRYAAGHVPRGTAHRIRRRIEAIHAGEGAQAWSVGTPQELSLQGGHFVHGG